MKIIPNSVVRSFNQQLLTAKANSPHIFFAAGVVGVLGAGFLACRATLKLEDTLDDIHAEITDVKTKSDISNIEESDHIKDLVYVYGKSSAKLVRLYGPSVVVGSLAIASLTGAHIQLTRRNTALAAAFTAVSKAFEEYRVKIQEEIGTERERDIYLGIKDEEIINEKGEKEIIKAHDGFAFSPYARVFDEANPNWEKHNDHNKVFLQLQQNWFNQKLQSRGHVFLNEVYDKLGFTHSHAGALVGWIRDGDGDGHIDFGLYETRNNDFFNSLERNIVLDFNVDGLIHEKF